MIRFRKIFYYSLITLGFALCFIFGKGKINILALKNVDNTLGSYPLQLDIDNYNTNNIYNMGVETVTSVNWFLTKDEIIKDGETYTIYFKVNTNGTGYYNFNVRYYYTSLGNEPGSILTTRYEWDYGIFTYTFTAEGTASDIWINGWGNVQNLEITDIMLIKGNTIPNDYYPPFKFGFALDLVLNSPTKSEIKTITYLNNYECSNITNSYNVGSYNKVEDVCFIPFNIDKSGLISLENISIKTLFESTDGNTFELLEESGYILRPVLIGYYKEIESNGILYLKKSYIANNFFINGINIRGQSSLGEGFKGSAFQIKSLNNEPTIGFNINEENNIYNIINDKQNEVNYYNQFVFRDVFDYDLSIDFGYYTTNTDINSLTYYFNFSGLNSIVLNNNSTSTPISSNADTIDKYESCSAWYDIPCQLGNAITYVIYEAPIISPIFTFVVSFVSMFSNLVTFVDLFRSFGILFGCFILYMFINLLHKYSK